MEFQSWLGPYLGNGFPLVLSGAGYWRAGLGLPIPYPPFLGAAWLILVLSTEFLSQIYLSK